MNLKRMSYEPAAGYSLFSTVFFSFFDKIMILLLLHYIINNEVNIKIECSTVAEEREKAGEKRTV